MFSYNLSLDNGKVRLLVPDSNENSYIFEDEEIDAFLAMEGNVKRAAAMALETIASNETLVLKVISLLDLTTDGAKVADALLKRAKLLRDQAEQDDLISGDGGWAIANWVVSPFAYREIVSGYYPD